MLRPSDPQAPAQARTEASPPCAPAAGDSPADDADVWLLAQEDVERFAEATGGRELLTEEERKRHDRILTPGARHRFLGARLLSRQVLSLYAGLPPAAWRFRTGRYGRPVVDGDAGGLDFNITHTEGLIAVVVVRGGRVAGIDAEPTPALPDVVDMASKVVSPLENALLRRMREDRRGYAFADFWVAKEAYTKATGSGMCRRFDGFSIHRLGNGRLTVLDDEIPPRDRVLWQIEVLRVWERFALGIAIRHTHRRGGPSPVRLRSAMVELLTAQGGHRCDTVSRPGPGGTP